jgi:hypothetical protein
MRGWLHSDWVRKSYKNLFFDVCMLLLNAFDFSLFPMLLDDLHGVDAAIGLFADQDDLGIVADADLAEHAEVLKGH